VGFEPTTPGSKVTRSAAEPRTTAADSNSAVLTAWTGWFLVESAAQVRTLSRAPDSTQRLYVPGAAVSRLARVGSDHDPEGVWRQNATALAELTSAGAALMPCDVGLQGRLRTWATS